MAKAIYRYLVKHDYTDNADQIAAKYHEAKSEGTLAALPPELAPYASQVFQLIDGIFSDAHLPGIDDERKARANPLNANFKKKEFQELWGRINRRAAYTVQFETPELMAKCVAAIDNELKVSPLQYTIQRGEQTATSTYDDFWEGQAFELRETETCALPRPSIQSTVKYDLIGKLRPNRWKLTRRTIGSVLQESTSRFSSQYRMNPEDFILKAARLINEQRATVIVEHLAYNPVEDSHTLDIFCQEKPKEDFSKAVKTGRHIYDYVFTDSANEREFVRELDTGTNVVVYAKLPRTFFIPTPVGDYSPDWAIAFHEGTVKHVYFIAETKGSLSSMDLRKIEECKIDCARKFFRKIASDQVKYDVVDGYAKLMELVK